MALNVDQARQGHAPALSDAVRTVSHLHDSVAFHLKHATRHLDSSHEAFHRGRAGDPNAFASAAWNGEHAARHLGGLAEHADKITDHLAGHPDLGDVVADDSLGVIKAGASMVSSMAQRAVGALERGLASLPGSAEGDEDDLQTAAKGYDEATQVSKAMRSPVGAMHEEICADPLMAEEAYHLASHDPIHHNS